MACRDSPRSGPRPWGGRWVRPVQVVVISLSGVNLLVKGLIRPTFLEVPSTCLSVYGFWVEGLLKILSFRPHSVSLKIVRDLLRSLGGPNFY